ncbi:hypothetical protein H9Q72_009345 [Fusarium xylarioides]|uniref:Uncharacterized protein n=1 Tax=Fusarium xylarioides TaxID=221167 RepID=A0A9P7HVB4_9HYPO|nr:hypothetical protein H9Q70_006139 [Fusarium xylarioides]KAG5762563.1 hypothetical protein H9Q72_009345 [Fusarium xylarioides]KAG5781751.1 hypothetical protein H9Q73_004569 [Fusarium xylarioides]
MVPTTRETFQSEGWPDAWVDDSPTFNRDDAVRDFCQHIQQRDRYLESKGATHRSFSLTDEYGQTDIQPQIFIAPGNLGSQPGGYIQLFRQAGDRRQTTITHVANLYEMARED